MKKFLMNTAAVAAFAVPAFFSPAAEAQSPATGIDPAVIRINPSAVEVLGSDIVPYFIEAAGLDDFTIDEQMLYDQTFNWTVGPFHVDVPDIGVPPFVIVTPDIDIDRMTIASVRFRVSRGETHIRIPLDENDVQFSFSGNGSANSGTLSCNIHKHKNNLLETSLRVRTTCSSPALNALIPLPDVHAMFNLDDTFSLNVDDADLALSFTMSKNASNQWVFTAGALSGSVGNVDIDWEEQEWLEDIFNFFNRTWCLLTPENDSSCSFDAAVTKMCNFVLKGANTPIVKNMISNGVTNAMRGLADVGGSVTLPAVNGKTVTLGTVLSGFATNANKLLMTWNLSAATNGALWPSMAYSYLSRSAQNPATEAAAGDMQVWLPYSLFDKTAWALLKSGLGSQAFQLPAMRIPIVGGINLDVPATSVKMNNPVCPRATPVPGSNQVELKFNTGIISAASGGAVVNLNVEVKVRVGIISQGEDIKWQLVSVQANILSGTVVYGGRTIQYSSLPASARNAIQSALNGQWSSQAATYPLCKQVIAIGGGWSIELGNISLGSRYVQVPVSLVQD